MSAIRHLPAAASAPAPAPESFRRMALPDEAAGPEAIPLMVARLPGVDDILPYLRQIDDNRWYTNFGPLVRSLEERLGDTFADAARADVVTLSSGTAALEMALAALRLPAGATVMLPALTFVATATAVIRAGYRPLLVDVDADSWLLTPALAREFLRANTVDAVLPVATFGVPQDVVGWDAFVAETGVPVLIDAAGAFGNQAAGAACHVAFSMHATKALAAGEGGFVVTSDADLAARIRTLSNFGIDVHRHGEVRQPGGNGKLSEYHAAVAHAALDLWPQTAVARRALRERYLCALTRHCPPLQFQTGSDGGVFPILVTALPPTCRAQDAREVLAAQGIETRQWYCPTLDRQPAFATTASLPLPRAHALAERLLGLPFFTTLTDVQIERVCRALGAFLEAA